MTFLLFLYVQNLKGKDAFVYQLLSEAKFEVKLSAIDVRVDGCGNDDDGDDDLCDIDLDLMDEIGGGVHFSELDLVPTDSSNDNDDDHNDFSHDGNYYYYYYYYYAQQLYQFISRY